MAFCNFRTITNKAVKLGTWYIIPAPINLLFEVTTIFLSNEGDGMLEVRIKS